MNLPLRDSEVIAAVVSRQQVKHIKAGSYVWE